MLFGFVTTTLARSLARSLALRRGTQAFMLTIDGEIRTSDDLCLDAWGTKMPADVFLQKCHGNKGNQQWVYKDGTALSGSISTLLTGLSWICVGTHSRRALPSPVCA